MSYKRKLTALNYHAVDKFNVNDKEHIKHLILWLEEQKIRHYSIEGRADLRNLDSPHWVQHLTKYLNNLECPYGITNPELPFTCDWLLGLAIRLEYTENAEKYRDVTSEEVKKSSQAPQLVQSNVLDNLDFDTNEFKSGVESLANILGVTSHPDHLITLKAISIVINEKFGKEFVPKNPNQMAMTIPLEKTSLGFDTGDYILNSAAKILRLLHIRDLRDLQTKINEAIVEVQSITANPKTDTKIGQVGR